MLIAELAKHQIIEKKLNYFKFQFGIDSLGSIVTNFN